MGAIPGGVETDTQPPMTVPLRHFLVGLGFLLAGLALGLAVAFDAVSGLATLAHVHLLLVGWVCVTIVGAMTQFVPVWSGTTLHSRRLANAQLVLLTVGLGGFAAALLTASLSLLVPFAAVLLAGFWTFVYNVGRTLATADDYDVTERHFALALAFFLAVTALGILLAAGYTHPVFGALPVTRPAVVGAHATLAVFGAVLTTVYGALYQLGTMFTQTELHGVDERLQTVEELGHPVGVVLLAGGRLTGTAPVARIGAVLLLAAALAVAAILGRKLVEMQVERTPMHARYAVAVPALSAWALATLPAWLRAPLAPAHRFGAEGTAHLLALGAVGFVVLGTLYHVVPFVVWVHRYSDRLGLEAVPMVDDLYDDRLAAADATLLVAGTGLLVAANWIGLPAGATAAAGALVGLGAVLFAANLLLVIREHGPHSLGRVLFGALDPRRGAATPSDSPADD